MKTSKIGTWKNSRLQWYWYADKRYLFQFTFNKHDRCAHKNWLGITCFRPWVYDCYCGLHNSLERWEET